MIRKYHNLNHKLQTNPRYCEEEPHNNHKTLGRQTKQSNSKQSLHLGGGELKEAAFREIALSYIWPVGSRMRKIEANFGGALLSNPFSFV